MTSPNILKNLSDLRISLLKLKAILLESFFIEYIILSVYLVFHCLNQFSKFWDFFDNGNNLSLLSFAYFHSSSSHSMLSKHMINKETKFVEDWIEKLLEFLENFDSFLLGDLNVRF